MSSPMMGTAACEATVRLVGALLANSQGKVNGP